MKIKFELNGEQVEVEAPSDSILMWVLRERLGLMGTKYGCGVGGCGACTVHVDGEPLRSCVVPASAVASKKVTTIEGLSKDGEHPLQKAWIEEQAPQCGYCHSGMLMQAAHLLEKNPSPTREEIVAHMDGILCRCGTYGRVIRAIQKAAKAGAK